MSLILVEKDGKNRVPKEVTSDQRLAIMAKQRIWDIDASGTVTAGPFGPTSPDPVPAPAVGISNDPLGADLTALNAAIASMQRGFSVSVRWEPGDLSSKIQEAFSLVYNRTDGQGGTVFLADEREYSATGLVIPPRVGFVGGGTALTEVYPGQADSGAGEPLAIRGPVLKQLSNASLPLLRNDPDATLYAGYRRQGSNVLNDSGNNPLPHRYVSTRISGITFEGNSTAQTIPASLLYFERGWSIEIERCNVMHSRGFGLELNDCNTVSIDSVWSHYAPWFLYDTADSQIQRCSVSGSNQFGAALWVHSSGSSNLLSSNNLFYNSSVNDEAQWTNPTDTANVRIRRSVESITASAGSDTLVNITSHKLYDEMPVLLVPAPGATLPAGLFADRVYWIKRINGNTVKLAENRNRCRLGVFVQATTAGSGTIYVDRGPAANVALTGGANRIQLVGGRVDQSYGDGVLCLGSPNNTILTNVNQSGLGSTDPRAGVRLRSGYAEAQPSVTQLWASSDCVVLGNIDGTITAYGGKVSNQARGVVADDDASRRGLNTSGCASVNHSDLNFSPSAIGAKVSPMVRTSTAVTLAAVGSAADQTNATLYSVVIPKGALGKNGYIEIDVAVSANNTVAREFSVQINGANMGPLVALANKYYAWRGHRIYANNSLTQVKIFSTTAVNTASGVDPSIGALNHGASDLTLTVVGRWTATATAGDTLKMEACDVRVVYAD